MSQEEIAPVLRVAIIGGGIGGTALALALSTHQNIHFTIYESRAEFGEIGAGLAFAPNAHRVMELMSPALWQGYKSRASFKGYKPVVRSGNDGWEETGGLWADVTVGEGVHAGKRVMAVTMDDPMTLSTAHRADFMEEIVNLLPEGCVEFNKVLVDVKQGDDKVVCKFSDGRVVEADAVIGCDGVRSICRKFVFEKEADLATPVFSEMVAYRGLVPMNLAENVMGTEKAHNRNIIIGHDRHVITFPVSDGSLVNAVALSTRKQWEGSWIVPGQKANMMQEFSEWDNSVKKILELVENPSLWALFDHCSVSTFHRDGLCLLGDAAHSTTPHIAQGASMALEDAYILSCLLPLCKTRRDILAAFDAYESVRIPRALRVTAVSREHGKMMSMEDEFAGDDIDRIAEALNGKLRWIWELVPEDHLADAVKKFHSSQKA